jgi:glycosyltransferase involved in cell wall biosynthesis
MSLTIGIPVYNEEKTLIKTLDSVVNSCQCLNANIVLCFNGTTDNGINLAKKYNKFPLEIISSSKDKPSAVKKIAEHNTSEFLIFVDADVIVDKNCFTNIHKAFKENIIAVAGQPIPYKSNNATYKIINARMLNPYLEISLDGSPKEFLHGRVYGIRKKILDEISKNFSKSMGDDTFLSHYILLNYGRDAIAHVNDANVFYQPVTSIKSWRHCS